MRRRFEQEEPPRSKLLSGNQQGDSWAQAAAEAGRKGWWYMAEGGPNVSSSCPDCQPPNGMARSSGIFLWTHNPFPQHTTGHNWIILDPEKEFFSEPHRPRCHRLVRPVTVTRWSVAACRATTAAPVTSCWSWRPGCPIRCSEGDCKNLGILYETYNLNLDESG